MARKPLAPLAALGALLAIASCAPQITEDDVIEPTPGSEAAVEETIAPVEELPPIQPLFVEDDLRMPPDLYDLPSEDRLRTGGARSTGSGTGGSVISRPPTDPPSRPRPPVSE